MKEINLAGLTPWGGLAGHPIDSAEVIVAGIPYDGSAVYRKGAARAPMRIRDLSAVMPPVTEDGRPLNGLKVHDLGDLDVGPEIETGWSNVADQLAALPSSALSAIGGTSSPRMTAAARNTAWTGLTYPVQRHSTPLITSRASASDGLGFLSMSVLAQRICAGVQYPHWIAPVSTNACWSGCISR